MFEDVPSLMPMQFFGLACECFYLSEKLGLHSKYLLPSTAEGLDEESFADVYSAWNEEKFSLLFDVARPFQGIGPTDFRKGDSIEVWIDTRDLKSKPVVSRFCHHFVFFPVEHQGCHGKELSRFRNEDAHSLCSSEDLEVRAEFHSNGYRLWIDIPQHCLFGYEPQSCPKLGFTYRINRSGHPPQHFSISSKEYVIEQHPALWATLKLES